jgi:hypothetical protein
VKSSDSKQQIQQRKQNQVKKQQGNGNPKMDGENRPAT